MEGKEPPPSAATLEALFQRDAREALDPRQAATRVPAADALRTGDAAAAARCSWFARRLIADRRARDATFGADLFYDPAWDLLLELFAAHGEGKLNSVKTAVLATGCPEATALRWIDRLEDRGLVSRHEDPQDSRRHIVELTSEGLSLMRNHLRQVGARWDMELC